MLSDITILDLSRLMPGPYCTMLLADLGARVIAVESPREAQDVTATRFPSLLRNKRHMVLDLKSTAGQAVFFRMVGKADAVVEGYRPGTLSRLGVDYDAARAVNPRIVYCSITGYGQEGPHAEQAGHDINFLARSGLLDLMIPDGAEPHIPAVQFADMTGAMAGAMALLAALRERDRTGEGRHLDISMTDAVAALPVTSATFRQKGWPFGAGTSLVGGGLACYGAYRTRDGRLLAVGALEAVFFRRLCEALGLEELVPHQYVVPRQAEMRKRLEAVFAEKTHDEWVAFFADKDCCVTGVPRFEQALASPQRRHRGAVRQAKEADGSTIGVLGMPLAWPSKSPSGGRIPNRGEHTDAILRDLHYTKTEIETLREAGIVT
jgi:crotonobetainyl-CoA:carnitine CoA-transferase CaiB-like acyl-CoA transferase